MPRDSIERLPRAFYRRDAISVARNLLGQRLVSVTGDDRTAGTIVETEAYLGTRDRAAHTHGGRRTERVRSMWGDGGHAYVYLIYGMHHCMNVVASVEEDPVAVLVRALEPTEGLDEMERRRPRARSETDLCSGPGKLCAALGIDREHDGEDLVRGNRVFVEALHPRPLPDRLVATGPRIGIDYAGEWAERPLRFWVRDSPHVSR